MQQSYTYLHSSRKRTEVKRIKSNQINCEFTETTAIFLGVQGTVSFMYETISLAIIKETGHEFWAVYRYRYLYVTFCTGTGSRHY